MYKKDAYIISSEEYSDIRNYIFEFTFFLLYLPVLSMRRLHICIFLAAVSIFDCSWEIITDIGKTGLGAANPSLSTLK